MHKGIFLWSLKSQAEPKTLPQPRYIWSLNYKPFGSGQWFSKKQAAMEAFFHGEYVASCYVFVSFGFVKFLLWVFHVSQQSDLFKHSMSHKSMRNLRGAKATWRESPMIFSCNAGQQRSSAKFGKP